MKTVYYQPGMEELADELTLMGYRTVCIRDAHPADRVDAILVDKGHFDASLSSALCQPTENGALLIDATDADISRIRNILVKRSYHPLFE